MKEVIETAALARDRMFPTREQEPQAHVAFEHVFKYKANPTEQEDKDLLERFKGALILGWCRGTNGSRGLKLLGEL